MFKVRCAGHAWFIGIGYYDDGQIGEVWIDTAKAGTVLRETMQITGMALSLAFQYGAPPSKVVSLLSRTSEGSVFRVLAEVLAEAGGTA